MGLQFNCQNNFENSSCYSDAAIANPYYPGFGMC
ncbi:hypothetical protein CA51_41880 [Rosistilla oblonga]|nr:hypothetical protein CA51_41880 [Rosistilla oblonga]